jgi:putative transcription factor
MQCELCGATSKSPLKTVRVEGAELQVCSECAKYGTEVQQPRHSPLTKRSGSPPVRVAVRRTRDVFDRNEGELVEDYGERIRMAREAKGWSQKDLALSMMERELLVKKIEKGDLIPEDDVRKKLEKTLGITLTEGTGPDEERRKQGPIIPTLGDLISIKKVKR